MNPRTDVFGDGRCILLLGDACKRLRDLPPDSVHCVVTSPPYLGLRTYSDSSDEIGQEPHPFEYVEALVQVFREIRRVLHPEGTVWLNLGDSYNSRTRLNFGASSNGSGIKKKGLTPEKVEDRPKTKPLIAGFKYKDLIGIPWRVAFALQEDGWWLRSDIIWNKTCFMPEKVTDRPTRAHEYVFLLTKSREYFYDNAAIGEPLSSSTEVYMKAGKSVRENHAYGSVAGRALGGKSFTSMPKFKNKRDVWTVGVSRFSPEKIGVKDVKHFATFPPELIEPMIKAGSSEKGCCPKCGKQWKRVIEKEPNPSKAVNEVNKDGLYEVTKHMKTGNPQTSKGLHRNNGGVYSSSNFVGWMPSCECGAEPTRCLVLDPFCGSGTTGVVALNNERAFLGIDLNPAYVELAEKRIKAEVKNDS